jgi:hypothetical protein
MIITVCLSLSQISFRAQWLLRSRQDEDQSYVNGTQKVFFMDQKTNKAKYVQSTKFSFQFTSLIYYHHTYVIYFRKQIRIWNQYFYSVSPGRCNVICLFSITMICYIYLTAINWALCLVSAPLTVVSFRGSCIRHFYIDSLISSILGENNENVSYH